jgi:L-alanine-DL-glutamate epimerase-like enolase superfamily enzyme
MIIKRLSLYAQWQPFRDGTYTCSGGRSAEGFDSTIIKIETADGVAGWGEMAPLGSFYDPSFAAGARAGIKELAPQLTGLDCRDTNTVNRRMDLVLKGHPYIKAAIDMALWDAIGRATGMPLYQLMGGAFGQRIALYRSIPQMEPEAMAKRAQRHVAEGYRRLQVKVGLDVRDDIQRLEAVRLAIPSDVTLFADANGSWRSQQAREFLAATRGIAYALEQPCGSYEEIRSLRAACDRPLILDESIDGLEALLRARADGVVDGITIKIARVGGLTKAKLIRDVATEMGIGVTIEDTGGAQIDTAAIAHMMLSTPEEIRQHTVDFHNWVTVTNGKAEFDCRDGSFTAPAGLGLGVEVIESALGKPIFVTAG